MTCQLHSLHNCKLCKTSSLPGYKPKPPFGTGPRKPLKKTAPKKPKMSADAKVQDAMLGKGRCWLVDYSKHTCTDGRSQRSHIVSQQTIADTFPLGAVRRGERWVPVEEGVTYSEHDEFRPLQVILDDTRNIVPACPNGNVDGLEMVEALGELGFPPGFDEFCAEYSWAFGGRYWYREVKPVVLDPRAAA